MTSGPATNSLLAYGTPSTAARLSRTRFQAMTCLRRCLIQRGSRSGRLAMLPQRSMCLLTRFVLPTLLARCVWFSR